MKRYLLTILTLIPLFGNSQTVIPNAILDSMIWEVAKGRHCDSLQRVQQKEIEALGSELIANQNAVSMQTRQLSTLDSLSTGLRQEVKVVEERGDERLKIEKKKSRRFKIAAALEGLLILILIL